MDQTLTYDELCEAPPAGWTVEAHQSHADTGVVIVDAPGHIVVGIPLKPGDRIHYEAEDDVVRAYSISRAEGGPSSTPAAEPAGSPAASATPPSEPSEPEPSAAVVDTIEDALAKADAHLMAKVKPTATDKGATK